MCTNMHSQSQSKIFMKLNKATEISLICWAVSADKESASILAKTDIKTVVHVLKVLWSCVCLFSGLKALYKVYIS